MEKPPRDPKLAETVYMLREEILSNLQCPKPDTAAYAHARRTGCISMERMGLDRAISWSSPILERPEIEARRRREFYLTLSTI
jgi:hypothetical protein